MENLFQEGMKLWLPEFSGKLFSPLSEGILVKWAQKRPSLRFLPDGELCLLHEEEENKLPCNLPAQTPNPLDFRHKMHLPELGDRNS